MPLIVVTGYPSCGKSTRAKQLENFFQNKYPDKKVGFSQYAVFWFYWAYFESDTCELDKTCLDANIEFYNSRRYVVGNIYWVNLKLGEISIMLIACYLQSI